MCALAGHCLPTKDVFAPRYFRPKIFWVQDILGIWVNGISQDILDQDIFFRHLWEGLKPRSSQNPTFIVCPQIQPQLVFFKYVVEKI